LEYAMNETFRRGEAKRALISVMHVNNELGTIQPVAEIARAKRGIADRSGADIRLHTDAIQSYGKLAIDVTSYAGTGGFGGVDLLSCSAHKTRGPKGVGALYAGRPGKVVPIMLGGGQERGMRSGTENVPGIAGFGAAVSEGGTKGDGSSVPDGTDETSPFVPDSVAALRERLLRGILGSITDVRVNSPERASTGGEAGLCSPYILNVSFLGTRGEVILHDLEQRGVFVSTGSACSNIGKSAKRMNPVLVATGMTAAEAEGAVRFSLSPDNKEEEIDYALENIRDAVKRFRRIGTFRSDRRR
jgi:cysteine desulfurase